MNKILSKERESERGFSLVELFVVLAVLAIMMVVAVPYFYNFNRLYKSEDQSIRIMDLMREAGQLAINRRRTMRFEIDLTENAVLIIDENGAAPDTRVKTIPLERTGELRVDTIPAGVTKPNPPNFADATFATDTLGHQFDGETVMGHNVWACRFRSDGSVVDAADVPISANIYVWPPVSYGATTPRNVKEVRAVTIFGGSGAVRYWKHNGTVFVPYQ